MQNDDFDELVLDAVGDAEDIGEALSELEMAEQEAEAFRAEVLEVAAFELYTSDTITKPGMRIQRTFPVVTARRVEGMHLFKDIALALRDTFGGRSNAAENAFEQLEQGVLNDLYEKVQRRGANAAIRLRIQYGEISGGGKAQMFYVAGQATPVMLVEVEAE